VPVVRRSRFWRRLKGERRDGFNGSRLKDAIWHDFCCTVFPPFLPFSGPLLTLPARIPSSKVTLTRVTQSTKTEAARRVIKRSPKVAGLVSLVASVQRLVSGCMLGCHHFRMSEAFVRFAALWITVDYRHHKRVASSRSRTQTCWFIISELPQAPKARHQASSHALSLLFFPPAPILSTNILLGNCRFSW
jgi:hypothetical protein